MIGGPGVRPIDAFSNKCEIRASHLTIAYRDHRDRGAMTTAVTRELSADLRVFRLRACRWSPYRFSDHPPRPVLWAVEPHPDFRGTGATFEELRVVTDSRGPRQSAFWLDDDLPHVRRWAEGK
ncbi:hypothetical protein ALMP_51480 [Streptomyces sp. A012304]|nr:hypothetical protein ALMP_51480 [Streptomyces sp. A012304]